MVADSTDRSDAYPTPVTRVAKSPQESSDRVPWQFNLQFATSQKAWHRPLQAATIDKDQHGTPVGILGRNMFDVGQCSVRRQHPRSPLHYLGIVSEGPVLATPRDLFCFGMDCHNPTGLAWAHIGLSFFIEREVPADN
jgi:hypothetical protein